MEKYTKYLLEKDRLSSGADEKTKNWSERIKRFFIKLHQRGRKRLTVMLVPHTEKKILTWHVSIYTLFSFHLILGVIMVLSVISLISKSGEDIQFYDMGLGNRQFGLQTIHIVEELLPLHRLIDEYTTTIFDLYLKLDGDKAQVQSLNPEARTLLDNEIEKLKLLVKKCRFAALKGKCQQKDTEEILRKAIYLSYQDNHNIKKAINLSERILDILDTKDKLGLLKNTPSILPTQGYLLNPYGLQISFLRGREVFKRGIDIVALPGTQVLATAPGEIWDVSYDKNYGLKIYIQHAYGIATFYAHLDRARVQKGERVEKGEIIGYVGSSGNIAIPLLHYEVHVGTIAYNPYAFINHIQDPWLVHPKI